ARPFALTRNFVALIVAVTDSPIATQLLDGFEARLADPDRLARTILIELLAWQFASPVRWITTQDLLVTPQEQGGLGVEQIIEVGVGYQPTLANMARYTMAVTGVMQPIDVFNLEADADTVLHRTEDAPVVEVEAPSEPAAKEEGVEAVAQVAAIPAVPVAPVSSGPVEDRPVSHTDALLTLLALQARIRPEQIQMNESIETLFDGVSSRRNQVLLDIGAEFNLGTIDGAHEKPIQDLVAELQSRAGGYRAPGRYLKTTWDETLKRVFGRSGLNRRAVASYGEETFGLGEGLQGALLNTLSCATREGDSMRGGLLGGLDGQPASRTQAHALLDAAVGHLAAAQGLSLPKRSAATSGAGQAVDAAAVQALEDRILGPQGVLGRLTRSLQADLGLEAPTPDPFTHDPKTDRLAHLEAELGAAFERRTAPRFEADKHVAFTSVWAFAQRDVATLYYDGRAGRIGTAAIDAEAQRLSIHGQNPRICATARWYAQQAEAAGKQHLARALTTIAEADAIGPAVVHATRPEVEIDAQGTLHYREAPLGEGTVEAFMARIAPSGDTHTPAVAFGTTPEDHAAVLDAIQGLARSPGDFAGRCAVVTGASPGSIAIEVVRHLLRGGAKVVVTTSSYRRERVDFYRRLYGQWAGPGAELHVVPFNQASRCDTEALVSWLFSTVTEQSGANVKTLKRPFAPDLVLPFAALPQLGTLDQDNPLEEVALRAMLTGVGWLITGIARHYCAHGLPAQPCHVVLPLSPNHGSFGGDGVYAETKAALEVLLHKWHSEHDAWGRALSLCGARIGWVRGTGLMDANNPIAAHLEAETQAITFNNAEMGLLLAGLCTAPARRLAATSPLDADLTGRFGDIPDLKATVDGIRHRLDQVSTTHRRLDQLRHQEQQLLGTAPNRAPVLEALPTPPVPMAAPGNWPGQVKATLENTVVIVGAGEVG
ncbi:MAG: hypothetical protein AAFX99_25845, partial [Myxococcota bacterium]